MYSTLQQGHIYSLMFSIIPKTLTFILRQKLSSLRTVLNETSCGVVTMIAPSGFAVARLFVTVKCSSDVPGGVSKQTRLKHNLSLV